MSVKYRMLSGKARVLASMCSTYAALMSCQWDSYFENGKCHNVKPSQASLFTMGYYATTQPAITLELVRTQNVQIIHLFTLTIRCITYV